MVKRKSTQHNLRDIHSNPTLCWLRKPLFKLSRRSESHLLPARQLVQQQRCLDTRAQIVCFPCAIRFFLQTPREELRVWQKWLPGQGCPAPSTYSPGLAEVSLPPERSLGVRGSPQEPNPCLPGKGHNFPPSAPRYKCSVLRVSWTNKNSSSIGHPIVNPAVTLRQLTGPC